ncbi:MAG: Uma2 family endonuclease [Bacteroidota bacterium]
MQLSVQSIPKSLIYEMIDRQPVYYKGYKEVLNGDKTIDELMGSSYLQSLIITQLVYLLMSKLDSNWAVLTNEIGLQLKPKSWRAADIAIIEKEKLKLLDETNKYLSIPPKVVIEIDTKAEIEEVQESYSYFHRKTDDLLAFGVDKVVWVFTDSRKVMIAERDQEWRILDWSKSVTVLEDISFKITDIVE